MRQCIGPSTSVPHLPAAPFIPPSTTDSVKGSLAFLHYWLLDFSNIISQLKEKEKYLIWLILIFLV